MSLESQVGKLDISRRDPQFFRRGEGQVPDNRQSLSKAAKREGAAGWPAALWVAGDKTIQKSAQADKLFRP